MATSGDKLPPFLSPSLLLSFVNKYEANTSAEAQSRPKCFNFLSMNAPGHSEWSWTIKCLGKVNKYGCNVLVFSHGTTDVTPITPNALQCPGFRIWTRTLENSTNWCAVYFLNGGTEVTSIVLLYWPSIYVCQHNKESMHPSGRWAAGWAHQGVAQMSPMAEPALPCPGTCPLTHTRSFGACLVGATVTHQLCSRGSAGRRSQGEVTWWGFTVSLLHIRTRYILIKKLESQARSRRVQSLAVWLLQGRVFGVD